MSTPDERRHYEAGRRSGRVFATRSRVAREGVGRQTMSSVAKPTQCPTCGKQSESQMGWPCNACDERKAMRLGETTPEEQLELLVSKRDRMVSIYRPSSDPIYQHGRELVATVTVVTDGDGKISIGVSHDSTDSVEVKFIDD